MYVQILHLKRQIKFDKGVETTLEVKKCTQLRCETSQNPPFLFCTHSIVNFNTLFIVHTHKQSISYTFYSLNRILIHWVRTN